MGQQTDNAARVQQIIQAFQAGAFDSPEAALALLAELGIEGTEGLEVLGQQGLEGAPPELTDGVSPPPIEEVVNRQRATSAAGPLSTDPFLLRESDPRGIFRGFTSGQFDPSLSGAARQSALAQGDPAFLSFLLGAPEESFGATDEPSGFLNFLGQGGQARSPSGIASGIVDLAGQIRGGTAGAAKSEFFSGNEDVFRNVLGSALPRVNPLFRRAFQSAAQNRFQQFQNVNPGANFFQQLASQGGRLLGNTR